MNFILPLDKLLEAFNKELYGVLKESLLIAEHTINKGGKVIIEQKQDQRPFTLKTFDNIKDLNDWFEQFLESQSQWNIPEIK